MTLPLAYRAARRAVLSSPASLAPSTAQSTRHVSLSAIHQAKARPQDARGKKIHLTYRERSTQKPMRELLKEEAKQEAKRQRPAGIAPTYRIRKGKKDITERPHKAKPQSRQARFYDPSSPFGKKSLVYQLKAGKLDELKALQEKTRSKPSESPFQTTGPRPDLRSQSRLRSQSWPSAASRHGDRDRERPVRDSRDGRGAMDARDVVSQPSRGAEEPSSRDAPRRNAAHRPRRNRDPVSIPYTTAASQFLYGRAVVEAALRSPRRKLYKLYIYGGANRKNDADDALIRKLAERNGVPITVLHEDDLALMNKMASSRPHNGFVLEASPLPQPPLTALGPLPDDYASNPRYPLVLGHQSAEEAAVNGAPAALPFLPSRKPLVVVLDQILDPGNLGAILRTVSFLGVSAVGITRGRAAPLTPVALKASAGAAESLNLFGIGSLPKFMDESKANGWAVFAAVASHRGGGGGGGRQRRYADLGDLEEMDPLRREPCVLLIGNEGEGLNRMVVKKADYEVNIPNMSGSTVVDSLNVSVAAGLLCSAFFRGLARGHLRAGEEEADQRAGGGLW